MSLKKRNRRKFRNRIASGYGMRHGCRGVTSDVCVPVCGVTGLTLGVGSMFSLTLDVVGSMFSLLQYGFHQQNGPGDSVTSNAVPVMYILI